MKKILFYSLLFITQNIFGQTPAAPVITASNTKICSGETVVFTASGCAAPNNVEWSNGYPGISFSIPIYGTNEVFEITAICRNELNEVSTNSNSLSISVLSIPYAPFITSSANYTSPNTAIILTENGYCPSPYLLNWSTNQVGQEITVNPSQTTTYTAICTNDICDSPESSIEQFVLPPAPVISSPNTTICFGTEQTLTATGCPAPNEVNWSNGTVGLTTNIVFSLSNSDHSETTTATCRNPTSGLISGNSNELIFNVKQIPSTPNIVRSPSVTSPNTSITLTENVYCPAPFTLTWNTGFVGRSLIVAPAITTTYTAICTNNSCASPEKSFLLEVLPPTPTISSNKSTICAGETIVFTANGCTASNTVSWYSSTTGLIGTGITYNYISNANSNYSYSFNVFAKCVSGNTTSASSSTIPISITAIPAAPLSLSTTPSNGVFNAGSPNVTLNALHYAVCASPSVFVWDNNSTATTRVVTPTANTTYSANCKNGTCVSPPATLNVYNIPIPTITADKASICQGETVVFTASGCAAPNYVNWAYGGSTYAGTGPTFNYVTNSSSSGTIAISARCHQSTTLFTNYVNSNTISILDVPGGVTIFTNLDPYLSSPNTVYSGDPVTLTASNCVYPNIVEWDNNLGTGLTKVINPVATTVYTAKCKNTSGCLSYGTSITITVTNIKVTSPTPTQSCSSATIAVSFINTAVVTGSPYTVKFKKFIDTFGGCNAGISDLVTQATTSNSLNITLPSALTPSGQIGVCNSGSSGNIPIFVRYYIEVSNGAEVSLKYPVTIYSSCSPVQNITIPNKCFSSSSATVNASFNLSGVNSGNVLTAELSNLGGSTFPSTPITLGTLTSSSATSMVLNIPANTAAGTYKVKIKSSNPVGENTGNLTIIGIPTGLPTLTKNPTTPVASGTSVTLTASDCPNGNGVMWSTGSFGTSISVSPNTTTNYTSTCNNNCGQAPTSATITVEIVTPPTITPDKYSVCSGADAVFTATGCTSPDIVTWYNASTSATLGTGLTITVNPTTFTVYAAKCTRSGIQSGYSNSQGISITSPPPAPTAISKSPSTSVGPYNTVLLTVTTGGYNVKWNDGVYSNPRYVNPSTTSTYTAKNIASNSSPCESTTGISTTITVDPNLTPGIAISSASEYSSVLNNQVCSSQNLSFTSVGCASSDVVKWYRKTYGGSGVQIGTGSTLTTNNLSYDVSSGALIYYYATCSRGATTTPNSNEIAIGVTQISNPNGIIATPSGSVAPNTSVSLSSNGSCPSPSTIKWDDNSSNSTRTVTSASTTTYTLKCVNGICESTSTNLTVSVIGKLPAPTITTSSLNVCENFSTYSNGVYYTDVHLQSSGCTSPNIVRWYKVSFGAQPYYTGQYLNSEKIATNQQETYIAKCIDAAYNSFSESDASNSLTVTVRPKPTVAPTLVASPLVTVSNLTTNITGTCPVGTTLKWQGLSPTPTTNTIPVTANNTNLYYKALCESEYGCASSASSYKIEIPLTVSGANTLNGSFQLGNGKYTWGGSGSNGGGTVAVSNFAISNYHTGNFDLGSYFFSSQTGNPVNFGFTFNALFKLKNKWQLSTFQELYGYNPTLYGNDFESKFKYDASIPPCTMLTSTGSTVSLSGFCLNIGQNITDITVPAQVCEAQNMPFSITTNSAATSYLVELLYDAKFQYNCGGTGNESSSVIASKTVTSTSSTILIPEIFRNSGNTNESGCGGQTRTDGYRLRITPAGSTNGISVDIPQMFMLASCPPPCLSSLSLASTIDDISAGTTTKRANSASGKITATNKITGTANVIYQAKSIELNAGFKADNGVVFKAEVGGCN